MFLPHFCIRKLPINRISAQRFNFRGTLLFHHSCLLLQLRAWHTQLGLMRNWNGSESTRGSWYHHTFLSQASSDEPGTFSIPGRSWKGSPFMALDLSVSWASQKNWQKIKLEASIRVGLKIIERLMFLFILSREPQTSRNSNKNCILRNMFRGVTVLQVIVLHWPWQESPSKHSPRQRDFTSGTSGSIFLLENSRREKSNGLQ